MKTPLIPKNITRGYGYISIIFYDYLLKINFQISNNLKYYVLEIDLINSCA